MSNIGKKVKILWNDAVVIYPADRSFSKSKNTNNAKLTKMETNGVLVQDSEEGIIIKDPKTINIETNKKHPQKDPTFYFIPKGMIVNMDIVE
ncbi:MAG: hypothetical protein WCO84_01705 [bacterium]